MDTPTNDIATGGRHDGGTEVEAAREASRQARAAVRQEVHKLIAEVENLLRRVRDAADPEVARVRAEVESAVGATKKALAERVGQVRRGAGERLEAGDRYVHERAWRAIGVAAISGLVIGLLLARAGMRGRELS
jgi:ElaB/YqjD/DUF883 family membrane-anchored ribosome-binding protein